MYDEETEQLSDDLVDITGKVIDLTKTANNPNGVSLFTDANQTQYKSVYQYLHEISEIYDELDAKSKQELMEKLFGKNRANIGVAILQNMEAADKALGNMSNSAGNAEAEMEVITNSISYHLNDLKETWVGISQNVFESQSVKIFVDSLTTVSEVIGDITKAVGGLAPTLSLLGAGLSFKNFGRTKMFVLMNMPKVVIILFGYRQFRYYG